MEGDPKQSSNHRSVAQSVQKHCEKLEAICDSSSVSSKTLLLRVVKLTRHGADRLLQQSRLHVFPRAAVLHRLCDFEELAEKAGGGKRVGAALEVRDPKGVVEKTLNRVEMEKTLENGVQIAAVSEIVEATRGGTGAKRVRIAVGIVLLLDRRVANTIEKSNSVLAKRFISRSDFSC